MSSLTSSIVFGFLACSLFGEAGAEESPAARGAHEQPQRLATETVDEFYGRAAHMGAAGLEEFRKGACGTRPIDAAAAAFVFSPKPVEEVSLLLAKMDSCFPELRPRVILMLEGFPSKSAFALAMKTMEDHSESIGVREAALQAALHIARWPHRGRICVSGMTDCLSWSPPKATNHMWLPQVPVIDPVTPEEMDLLTKRALLAGLTSNEERLRESARRLVEQSNQREQAGALELIARDASLPMNVRRSAAKGWLYNATLYATIDLESTGKFGKGELVSTPEGVVRVNAKNGARTLVKPINPIEVK